MEDIRNETTMPSIPGSDTEDKSTQNTKGKISRKALVSIIVFVFVLAGAGIGAFFYIDYANQWVRTNNASVDGRIYQVTAQIPGRIETVEVTEGMFVQAGKLLATIYPNLPGMGVSRENLRVHTEEAELLYLQTKIYAPTSGYVAQIQAKAGEHILAGQGVMHIVNLDDLWIRANFSEEHIRYIRVGQQVEIQIDAYPEHRLTGRVANILPAGGSVFSLFPPDATAGNWVRVAQRIPVKIVFDGNSQSGNLSLRVGMLARVRVKK